jgi:hypothetical protein
MTFKNWWGSKIGENVQTGIRKRPIIQLVGLFWRGNSFHEYLPDLRLGGSLTNLALFGFSLRVFWTRSPGYAKVFSGLCFLEVAADIIEWVSHQDAVQRITSNCVTLS